MGRVGRGLFELFAPGAGHAAGGHWRRGAVYCGLGVLSLVAVVFHPVAVLAALGVRLASLVHCVMAESDVGERRAIVAFVAAAVVSTVVVRVFVVEAFKIPSGSMNPTIYIGDHVFVRKLGLPSDLVARVVVFEHPCQPETMFVSRVVAGPGDAVEVRCSRLHVNGKAVAENLKDASFSYDDRDGLSGNWVKVAAALYTEENNGRRYQVLHSPERSELPDNMPGMMDFPTHGSPSCQAHGLGGQASAEKAVGQVVTTAQSAGACQAQRHYVVPEGHVFVMGDNRDNTSDSRRWGAVPADNIVGLVTHVWWSSGPDGGRWGRVSHAID